MRTWKVRTYGLWDVVLRIDATRPEGTLLRD